MHPDRLNYLAYNNPVKRDIIAMERDSRGHWVINMSCGHTGSCVGHMTPVQREGWNCSECSLEHVKTSPRWANEFK